MDLRFVPLPAWPPPATADRKSSPFRSTYSATLDLLENELFQLDARGIVIEAGFALADLRNDGWPRAGAKPIHPGIRLRFQSGAQQFVMPCDTFSAWADNLRAIALSLEALRRINRYGVTRKREQYQGFAALPAGEAHVAGPPRPEAEALFLARLIGGNDIGDVANVTRAILADPEAFREASRKAIHRAHPDTGGSDDLLREMTAACVRIATWYDAKRAR
jgi:hypothetical protein